MRDLALELGIEGHVNGGTAAEYAGKLVTVARQRGLLLRLVELCIGNGRKGVLDG
jgi:hypothetical protein